MIGHNPSRREKELDKRHCFLHKEKSTETLDVVFPRTDVRYSVCFACRTLEMTERSLAPRDYEDISFLQPLMRTLDSYNKINSYRHLLKKLRKGINLEKVETGTVFSLLQTQCS